MSTMPCSSGTLLGHLDRDRAQPVGAEDPVARGLQRDQDLLVGILERACEPFSLSTPMISNGMPRISDRLADHRGRDWPPSISGTVGAEHGVALARRRRRPA